MEHYMLRENFGKGNSYKIFKRIHIKKNPI